MAVAVAVAVAAVAAVAEDCGTAGDEVDDSAAIASFHHRDLQWLVKFKGQSCAQLFQ